MALKIIYPQRLPKVTVKRDSRIFNHVFPQQRHGSEAVEECPPTLRHRRADFLERDLQYDIVLRLHQMIADPCVCRKTEMTRNNANDKEPDEFHVGVVSRHSRSSGQLCGLGVWPRMELPLDTQSAGQANPGVSVL